MGHNFKEIIAWEKSRDLVVNVYKLTRKFPSDEKFALTSQVKRAAVSISSNIAEGAGRKTNKDFARFLDISLGSAYELESQLINAKDLDFITKNEYNIIYKQLSEVQKLINGFLSSLRL